MNISKDLMLTILSMDVYNRGYGAGISGLSQETGAKVGNATIQKNAVDELSEGAAKSAGFYAVSYKLGNETIISYRGTDNTHGEGEGGFDIWEGWTIGAGDICSWISCVLLQWIQCKNFNVWRAI